MALQLHREEGQSAVETLYALPVMLFLFLMGFQLFAITWNAQYAHVRSRYDALNKNDRTACYTTNGGGRTNSTSYTVNAAVTTDSDLLTAETAPQRDVINTAQIICKTP